MHRLACLLPLLVACSSPSAPAGLAEIANGHLQVVDLSYPLNESNPYWPGENYSSFRFETIATLESDGVYSGVFSMPEHLGTHLDAPNHFEADQPAVDEISLQDLIAPMVVVDVRDACQGNADYRLRTADLQSWEAQHGRIPEGAVVFALTGWGQYWDEYNRYKNEDAEGQLHFPGFSDKAAAFLVTERSIKGIGIDSLSVDFGPSRTFSVHHIVNGAGGYNIENVANLEEVPPSGAWLIAAPVKIEKGSGGPVRGWAVFESR